MNVNANINAHGVADGGSVINVGILCKQLGTCIWHCLQVLVQPPAATANLIHDLELTQQMYTYVHINSRHLAGFHVIQDTAHSSLIGKQRPVLHMHVHAEVLIHFQLVSIIC